MGRIPAPSALIATVGILGALPCACSRVSTPAENAPVVASSAAIRAVVSARCDQEERCRNIGPARKWPSRHECVAEIGEEWKAKMNAQNCSGAVAATRLADCLTEAEREDCTDLLSAVSRIVTCRSGRLCSSAKVAASLEAPHSEW